MAQYSKVRILDVVTDQVAERDSSNNIVKDANGKDKLVTRVRAHVVPLKPDAVYVNLTAAGDEIINTFKALQGKNVIFPARAGVTDSGIVFLSLDKACEVDDIDLIPEKPASKPFIQTK